MSWNFDLATAPRDGTTVLLLIAGGNHPLEDAVVTVSIGAFHEIDEPGDGEWKFVGWNWYQDEFMTGDGTPIAWMPSPEIPDHPTVLAARKQLEDTPI